MEKVIIIGCPGSGKSTFGRALHSRTGLTLYHLDMLYWNADRTTVEKEVFLKRLSAAMDKEKWIIDGNYSSTMEMRLQACDTVFFLDYPTEVCLSGVEERKGKPRTDIPWVENEILDAEFLDFVRRFHIEGRPEILKLLKKYEGKNIVVFRSRAESEAYLQALK